MTTLVPLLEWFCDQGFHFCKTATQTLPSSLRVKHRFSIYSPRLHGTFECVFKEVLRVMHAFNSETLTTVADWPNSVQAIQSIINNSPSRRTGGCAPIKVHTGISSKNLLTMALTRCEFQNVDSFDQAIFRQKLKKNADQTLSASRKKAFERQPLRHIWFLASLLLETSSTSLSLERFY